MAKRTVFELKGGAFWLFGALPWLVGIGTLLYWIVQGATR